MLTYRITVLKKIPKMQINKMERNNSLLNVKGNDTVDWKNTLEFRLKQLVFNLIKNEHDTIPLNFGFMEILNWWMQP